MSFHPHGCGHALAGIVRDTGRGGTPLPCAPACRMTHRARRIDVSDKSSYRWCLGHSGFCHLAHAGGWHTKTLLLRARLQRLDLLLLQIDRRTNPPCGPSRSKDQDQNQNQGRRPRAKGLSMFGVRGRRRSDRGLTPHSLARPGCHEWHSGRASLPLREHASPLSYTSEPPCRCGMWWGSSNRHLGR